VRRFWNTNRYREPSAVLLYGPVRTEHRSLTVVFHEFTELALLSPLRELDDGSELAGVDSG
jgi:hypothetical protein